MLAEHVGAPTRDPNPRINRLWSRFHKDFRQDWDQNGARTDRVPVALALGFCVEAVRAEEHDPNVLPVAVSLLALARAGGLGRYGEAGSVLEVRPEVNLQSIKGVFAEIKGLTTTFLTKDADTAINRNDYDDTTTMLQA
eukprot:COSAG06_NODE_15501_length_1066_cov_1.576008_2_plen_138_part_01